jgi:hypothetical protein
MTERIVARGPFSGTDYLQIEIDPDYIDGSNLTIAVWVWTTTVNNTQIYVQTNQLSGNDSTFLYQYNTATSTRMYVSDGAGSDSANGGPIITGRWEHWLGMYDLDSPLGVYDGVTIWKDGRLLAQDATKAENVAGQQRVTIGADQAGGNPADGPTYLALPSIWNGTMGPANIIELANGKPPWEVYAGGHQASNSFRHNLAFCTLDGVTNMVTGQPITETGTVPYRDFPARYNFDAPIIPIRLGNANVTCAVTGTATASIDEDDITTGGKTIILTLSGGVWQPTSSTASPALNPSPSGGITRSVIKR